ncbi:DUF6683 family protein [Chamaesiphon sp. VAR_48_metabat_135_sub]|uniref:DUF6683 family protein n=1 Tax=Chamaesiphon sp. VAR_48_metabat_135_sub TaxID=2964699 RepID=UPI00286D21F0|nr:DUF6683 family protein [Chamaesiphon sp. VAR_48_metabat_135_sub]
MKARFIIKLVAVTLLFSPSNSARAQWFPNPALNAIQLDVNGEAIRSQVRNQNSQDRVNNVKPIAKTANTKNFAYRPSVAVSNRNLKKFVETARKVDPVIAQNLERLFASKDVLGQIQKSMVVSGLNSNNLADAYAVYWTTAWFCAQGRLSDDLPKAQMVAVRNQAANMLQAIPKFANATDAKKQEMAETMLLQSVLISASIDKAESDPVLLAKTQAEIDREAKSIGLDFDRMTLTLQGFRSTK